MGSRENSNTQYPHSHLLCLTFVSLRRGNLEKHGSVLQPTAGRDLLLSRYAFTSILTTKQWHTGAWS